MTFDKPTRKRMAQLQKKHPLASALLELEGTKMALELREAEVRNLKRRLRLVRDQLPLVEYGDHYTYAWNLCDLRKPVREPPK